MAGMDKAVPDLIVGHGVLGRLLARLTIAAGAPAPTVWEIDADRQSGAAGYEVLSPDDDPRRDYHAIYDASGNGALLNDLVGRIQIFLSSISGEPPLVALRHSDCFLVQSSLGKMEVVNPISRLKALLI